MESDSIQFPIKITEKLFISDIKSISNNYLESNKITHIIIIDKYLELGNDIDPSNYQIMSLSIESPKPEDNFLFGFSSICRFISNKITLFVSESGDSPLLPTLIISYLITRKNTLDVIKELIPSKLYSNIFEEYIKRLEEFDKYMNDNTPNYIFKCGKCRKTIFTDKQLMLFHDNSPKDKYSNKRRKNNTVKTTECTSYFLSVGRLMIDNDSGNNKAQDSKDIFEEIMEKNHMKIESGVIKCKKCSNKLGEFYPKGTQCSCGSWIVPAIQIVKSKVDKIKSNNS
jgi:dual specificity phosphatase 12